jgi:hypothetical protein
MKDVLAGVNQVQVLAVHQVFDQIQGLTAQVFATLGTVIEHLGQHRIGDVKLRAIDTGQGLNGRGVHGIFWVDQRDHSSQ